jgi:putative ABC transport system ATP-binding protein
VIAALAVELDGVSRTFPGTPEVHALSDVSLRIASGDYVSIEGPSGSGKSTMLNLLGLLDRPTSGEYVLDGVATMAATEVERAHLRGSLIGFVFQAFHLLPHRSVLENVMLPMAYNRTPRGERESRARDALARVGLRHRTDYRPGLLSGGERQRVAVARAIAGTPRLLLADEPTGNLDSGTTDDVMDLLEGLHSEGLTLAVITHDHNVAGRAGRHLHISHGRLTETI